MRSIDTWSGRTGGVGRVGGVKAAALALALALAAGAAFGQSEAGKWARWAGARSARGL
jgi:hypothetical protein